MIQSQTAQFLMKKPMPSGKFLALIKYFKLDLILIAMTSNLTHFVTSQQIDLLLQRHPA